MPIQEIDILVVDDDENMTRTITRQLHSLHLPIRISNDARHAMEIIENEKVRLLITDQLMPFYTGMELAKRLKMKHMDSLIILITGANDFELAVSAINEGIIYHFIPKPFEAEYFKEVVLHAIARLIENNQSKKTEHIVALNNGFNTDNDNSILDDMNIVSGLLSLLQAKDTKLYEHCVRVSELSKMLAKAACVNAEMTVHISEASILHDIGKLSIKDQILDKCSHLSRDEFITMKRHPQVGADLLDKLGADPHVISSVLQHHERVDGNGYPLGLLGDEICIGARIIKIADTYDALRNERSYKSGLSYDTTKRMMYEHADLIYDTALLDLFFKLIRE